MELLVFDQLIYEITGKYNLRNSSGNCYTFDSCIAAKQFIDRYYVNKQNAVLDYINRKKYNDDRTIRFSSDDRYVHTMLNPRIRKDDKIMNARALVDYQFFDVYEDDLIDELLTEFEDGLFD